MLRSATFRREDGCKKGHCFGEARRELEKGGMKVSRSSAERTKGD